MGNFQQNDAADDENDAEPAVKGGTVAENQNAEQKRSHGADTRPNGVGDADGNMFLCQIKECAAQGHGSHREDDPDDFMLRQMRHFKTKRPADFKQRRRNQINPGHVVLLAGYIVLKTRKKKSRNNVTVRNRDTMEQHRVNVADLPAYLREYFL